MDSIDVKGRRYDGRVDLFIVASGPLDGSAETQQLLPDKLRFYFDYINSDEFGEEFGDPRLIGTSVVVTSGQPPDPLITELIDRCRGWAAENSTSVEFELRTGEADATFND